MNATRASTITESPSIWMPIERCTPSFCHQVQRRMTGATKPSPASFVRWIHCTAAPMESTVAAAIEAMPTSEPLAGRCRPNRMITKKAIPGINGISHAFSRNHPAASITSTLHLAETVERDRAAVAIHEQHHRQPDAHLGGGDADDVEREHLPVDRARHQGEGDEVEVDGVEDQLNRHQHQHGVLAGDHAVHADAEQHRAEEEEVGGVHGSVLAGEDDGADGG